MGRGVPFPGRCCGSAKREAEELDARLQKLDLEDALGDRGRLADKLIEALFAHSAGAVGSDVRTERAGGRPAVEAHAEGNRGAVDGRPNTRFTSRAWKRYASRACDAVAVAARREIAQAPAGAHSLRCKLVGGE